MAAPFTSALKTKIGEPHVRDSPFDIGRKPVLIVGPTQILPVGVCLGHQAMVEAYGGTVAGAGEIVHGKMGTMHHADKGMFAGLPTPLEATRYHSLIVDRDSLPDCLEVTATLEDGTIMGLQHRELPMHGLQFHPESIRSEHGHAMLQNFLNEMKVLG